jgi:hypothetical protein
VNTLLTPFNASPTSFTYIITVPAGDTGLFILQPAVNQPQVVTNANTEIRGYVTVSLANPFGSNSHTLLLTPQQRGTFLPKGFTVPPTPPLLASGDYDQLAYGLPTATPGAQVTLSQINIGLLPKTVPNLPALSELSTLDPELLQLIQQDPDLVREPFALAQPLNPISISSPTIDLQTATSLEQTMRQIAERLDRLEQRSIV